MADHYTLAEVAWLAVMSYEDVLDYDTSPPDSFPDLLASGLETVAAPSADYELPAVVRWHDVQLARARVQSLLDQQVLELRLAGLSEAQIGEAVGRSQQAVGRRFRATMLEILAELGRPPGSERSRADA